jgi:hypothetical protein
VAQPIDDIFVAGHESADGSERFAECPHDEVYIGTHAEMVAHSASVSAKHAQAVCFIGIDAGVVFLFQPYNFRQVCQVAFHRENTVYHNQFHGIGFALLEFFFQGFHVVVLVFQ